MLQWMVASSLSRMSRSRTKNGADEETLHQWCPGIERPKKREATEPYRNRSSKMSAIVMASPKSGSQTESEFGTRVDVH
jgi:hypothetical protein